MEVRRWPVGEGNWRATRDRHEGGRIVPHAGARSISRGARGNRRLGRPVRPRDGGLDMSAGRDLLAEVLRAAGARAVPDREDHDIVFETAMTAWQRSLRSQRQRRWTLALAA